MLTIAPETRVKCLVALSPVVDALLTRPANDCNDWQALREYVDAWCDLQQILPPDYVAESFRAQFGVALE
ncbi:MAG: hypothetical protein AB1441_00845 [Bacillota bacterium]